MKKTLITLLALGGIAIAADEPYSEILTLPSATTATNKGGTLPDVANFANANYGSVFVGFNNGTNVSDYGTNGEGTWAVTDNVGTITLCGRGGKSGDYLVLVLGDEIQKDTEFTAITFEAGDISYNSSFTVNQYTLTLALSDGTSIISSLTAATGEKSVQLTFDKTQVWGENYRVIALLKGGTNSSGSNGQSYNVSGIKAALVPEPATATLSLLALAGLATRRRRK